MDADQAGMMHTLLAGVDLSENGQALDAIREVGPGKHFLGCAHTLANFETAFYRSPLADNNSYEQWEAEGRKDMPTMKIGLPSAQPLPAREAKNSRENTALRWRPRAVFWSAS